MGVQGQQQYGVINENQIYNNIVLNDKSFAYYTLTVTNQIYTGAQSLSIKVIPEQFDSDPDVFISKTNPFPSTPESSSWYCVRFGSDSCIISNNDINVGDILYLGVRCINPCQFTLATNYLTVQTVQSANRTQFRFDGYSSNIISFFIPPTNRDGNTRALLFSVESDDLYNPVDVLFSLDSVIYQVEERQIQNVFSNGVGYYFTEDDFGWCTSCYVYFLIDVINPSRYYVTATPSTRNPILQTSVPVNAIVNARQQECFQYFVSGSDNDVLIYSNSMQGETDLYVSNGAVPTNITDSRVRAIAIRQPQKALLYTAEDRNRTNLRTGLVQICVYGYADSSTLLTPLEENFNGRIDAKDDVLYTFNIERNNTVYFRYTSKDLNQAGNFTIQVASYNLSSNQQPPRLFYKVCPSDNFAACYLEVNEQRGSPTTMREIGFGVANITNGNTRTVRLRHVPQNCSNVNSCIYLFSVFFPDNNGPMKTSFQLNFNTFNPADMNLDETYKNILRQGQYFYYELLPGSTYGYQFLQSLKIKVQNIIGDADLVVSFTNKQPTLTNSTYKSNLRVMYESITLNSTGNFSLNRPIYIGVYAYTSVAYYLSFEATYELQYNEKLNAVVPIYESIANYNYFTSEYEESFYKFNPWWAGFEARTIVFFADVVFNDVFFYMNPNDYPMFYLTEYQDQNDIIVLQPDNPDYSIHSTYFVRARPSFGLYDLISAQQYIFNFFAFSQHRPNRHEDINLNENKLGFANTTAAFYRHFISDNNATYNFTVTPIIGDPALLIKLSNSPAFPTSDDVQSWDYKSDQFNTSRESILITFIDRSSKYAFCDLAGYNLNGGNKSCGFYIAVECKNACIFNITVSIVGREKQNLPFYLTEDNYVTGSVNYGEYKYFYYPISKTDTGEMILILNKTGNLRVNGDAVVLANLINETSSRPIQNWTYPTLKSYQMASSNYRSNQPEIVELCSRIIFDKCSNNSCVLLIGVLGLTPNVTSNFRLIVQKQQNKLFDNKPVQGVLQNVGDYNYYWFSSNISAINPNTYWKYIISSSVDFQGQDVDLYVTVLDGRYPVSEDFDFSSTNYGPDNIIIDSNDRFFDVSGYNKSNGILFMVGVKALTPNASYTLMMQGPNIVPQQVGQLVTGLQQTLIMNANAKDQNNTHYFRWYNWGQKDFRINIDVTQGAIAAYLNFVSEITYDTNGYLALPRNLNNSKWNVVLNVSQSGVLRVAKEDISINGLFCYYCWYYITIVANTTQPINYRISVNEVPDIGEEVPILAVNQNQSLTLPATGAVSQRKFILDSTDSITVTARVTTGLLVMYVGLYPNNAVTRFQWKTEGTGQITIPIKQTDPNLKAGAFYYITCQAGSGRTSFILSVNQRRRVMQLQDGQTYKDQFWSLNERVKLYYFQAPTVRNQPFRALINVTSLTSDFYPVILLNKQNFTSQPSDFRNLNWPNLRTFNYSFNDNFFAITNSQNYNFILRETGGNFTYFAVALYAFSYGLTDERKAQFQVSVTIDTRNLNLPSLPSYYELENTQVQNTFLQETNNHQNVLSQWIQNTYESLFSHKQK